MGSEHQPNRNSLVHARRASIVSSSSRLDSERLNQAFAEIHAKASQSDRLTSFSDFAPLSKPSSNSKDERSPATVASGFGNFYSRLRASVGPQQSREPCSSLTAQDSASRDVKAEITSQPVQHADDQQRIAKPAYKPSTTNSTTAQEVQFTSRNTTSIHDVQQQLIGESTSRSQSSGDRGSDRRSPAKQLRPRVASPRPPIPIVADVRKRAASRETTVPETSKVEGIFQKSAQQLYRATNDATNETSTAFPKAELPGTESSIKRLDSEDTDEPQSADGASPINYPETMQPWAPSEQHDLRLNLPLAYVTSSNATNTPSEQSTAGVNYAKPVTTTESVVASRARSEQYPTPNGLIYQMQRKVLNRDFWMKDENAKVCFSCGDSFNTFRRKHHCRLCGQIYCNTCTKLISGRPFGQSSKLRICNSCDTMLHEDESSDDSNVEHTPSTPQVKQIRFSDVPVRPGHHPITPGEDKHTTIYKHPALTNSNTSLRRSRDGKRPTTPGSIYERGPTLTRPASSRSLKSMNPRPRSVNHKPRRPRSQHMRSLSIGPNEAASLWQVAESNIASGHKLPAFQFDSVVDPDLEPFMSDEASSDDEAPNIGSVLSKDSIETQNHRLSASALRKGRSRSAHKTTAENQGEHDDAASIASSRSAPNRHQLLGRTMSTGSIEYFGPSRLGRSDNLIKSSDNLYAMLGRSDLLKESNMYREPLLKLVDHAKLSGDQKPRIELPSASLSHLRQLLKQFITDAKVDNPRRWDRALMPVLCECAASVEPSIHRGDDIDIRHYVKVKKIPAGSPADTAYVSGFVFSHNIALREMPRLLNRPRVLLVSFSLIYARHQQHFMSLEGVIAQEQEYLRNLSTRIKSLHPDVLLVQGDVAGSVKAMLHESNVAVVYNVKASTLHAVARFTQTQIVSSVDKLNMHPNHLGHCGTFEVKTFVHQAVKKSYIYISGCQRDLGCTVVLRGADIKTLRKLKWMVEFLCYVAYNLHLEACLMRDQFATLPPPSDKELESEAAGVGATLAIQMKDVADSYGGKLQGLNNRILSASSVVRLPDPYLLQQGRDKEAELSRIRQLQQSEQSNGPSIGEIQEQDVPHKFELVRPEMIYDTTAAMPKQVRDVLRAIHSAQYEKLSHSFQAIKRRWEAYIAGVVDPFSPLAHQRIVLLFSIVSNASSNACDGPDVLAIDFYQEHDLEEGSEGDMPLGEYIERLCGQAQAPCLARRCEHKMIDHHRQYVHGHGQVSVHVEKCPPRFNGMENTILMWSACQVCDHETQIAPMSAETWKYSFAMYLQLTFWGQPMRPRAGTCSHDINRDHVRCFGFRHLAVKFRYDPIQTVDVMFPRPLITWVVEKDLRLKNAVYLRIEERIGRYMTSVKLRLKSINLETISLEKRDKCKEEVLALLKRVNDQHDALLKKLQDKYMTSKYHEILPLNRAVRALQEHVAQWDAAFADFELNYFPSERDLRRLAAIQFRKTFLEKEDAVVAMQEEVGDESEEKAAAAQLEPIMNEKEIFDLGGEQEGRPTSERTAGTDSDKVKGVIDRSVEMSSPIDVQGTQVVQTLDLAMPTTSPPAAYPTAHQELSLQSSYAPSSDSRPSIFEPGPLDATVVSRVDSMQGERNTPGPELRHPSPVRVRGANPPRLFRSQTQPSPPDERKPPTYSATLVQSNTGSGTPQNSGKIGAENRAQENSTPSGTRNVKGAVRSMIPRPVGARRYETRVSELAKHFEQISREFEREKIRERRLRAARTRQSRAFPMASANPILEVFRDASEAVRERETGSKNQDQEQRQQTTSHTPELNSSVTPEIQGESTQEETEREISSVHTRDNSFEASYPPSESEEAPNEGEGPAITDSQDLEDTPRPPVYPQEMAKEEKSTFYQMLTSLWSERSASGWSNLEYPLGPAEHIFGDSDVIAREDEPSSLIAFALALHDYNSKVQRFRDRAKTAVTDKEAASQTSDTISNAESRIDDDGIEDVLLGKTATHMRYQFESGAARMQCKIFFSESFDAIRRKCGVADRFVESLSRCVKWDSKGGKTKSLFLKTLDERFVLKSLSHIEAQAFLKFAPDYFDFMSKTLFHSLPSVLAKMLGLYQVVLKNTITGTEYNWYMQVMENVFYEGPSNKMFDLKGSMRNRKVESTGEKNEVLLDENLLDYISQSPVYVRYHSSAALAASITNDTLFCSKQNVMDYSLIVGLYEDRKELMVGIIDWLRTYTWDKKLESWIKDRGKHKATVRSPKEYRQRFRRSIPRYFPLAPSCWQVFGVPRIEQARHQLEDDTDSGGEGEVAETTQ